MYKSLSGLCKELRKRNWPVTLLINSHSPQKTTYKENRLPRPLTPGKKMPNLAGSQASTAPWGSLGMKSPRSSSQHQEATSYLQQKMFWHTHPCSVLPEPEQTRLGNLAPLGGCHQAGQKPALLTQREGALVVHSGGSRHLVRSSETQHGALEVATRLSGWPSAPALSSLCRPASSAPAHMEAGGAASQITPPQGTAAPAWGGETDRVHVGPLM